MPDDADALALEHIAKRFGAAPALVDASLHARAGSVHALLGENGAGKTTLARIAFGLEHPDAGIVHVAGRPVRLASPRAAMAHGIGMVHQHFTSVPAMTVAENVALGGHGAFSPAAASARVRTVGHELGLELEPGARVGDLPVSAQQRLEIVKAFAHGARTLILDEPTAVLAPTEAADLMAMLRRFAAGGGTVVLITHKLREALDVADDVTVLRRGRTALAAAADELSEADVARTMIGSDVIPRIERVRAPHAAGRREAAVVLAARDLRVRDERGVERLRGVSLVARAGEVLGIAAVEGAGQRELLRALAGRLAPAAGAVIRPERTAFIPEDRHRDALILDFTLVENVALRGAGRARGIVPWARLAAHTRDLITAQDVRSPDADAPARTLSGGNQQKLVLARELDGAPLAVIAENPTRGLDLAATAAVHERLLAARDAGAAVVVHSSDLDEVLLLADRVVVLFAGTAREVEPEREAVGRAMLGLAASAGAVAP